MRVIVTDGHASVAVASVRSLGRHGAECVVAWHEGLFPLAATSRYCRGVLRVPDPLAEPDRYAERILEEVRRGDADAVLPVSDGAIAACASVRHGIESRAVYCAAREDAIEAAEDKWEILERGRRAGLAAPAGALVESASDWERARRMVAPPVVIRSRSSLVREGAMFRKRPSRVAFDDASASRAARSRLDRGEPFVVTPYRPGTGRGVYLFMAAGTALVSFGHIRVRETDPRGSPACAAAPVLPEAEEVRGCEALLAGLGIEGSAMVEFRRDADTGEDWLVEINPRLWGSLPLALHAGMDFPWWHLRFFAAREVPSSPSVDPSIRGCRYLSADVGHLLHALGGRPSGWEGPYPTPREAWAGFVESFRSGWGYYHQSLDDPLPGLAEPLTFLAARLGRTRE